MTQSSPPEYDPWRNEFRKLKNNPAGRQALVRQVVGKAYEACRSGQNGAAELWISLLAFWVQTNPDLGGFVQQTLDEQEHGLQTELDKQKQEKRAALEITKTRTKEIRQALDKQNQWIERAILLRDIERLESDERWQARDQLERKRLELASIQDQITRRQEQLMAQVRSLENDWHG
ncbi:MAG: hypothetical protein WCF84_14075 [Anaerolineae bacterium]